MDPTSCAWMHMSCAFLGRRHWACFKLLQLPHMTPNSSCLCWHFIQRAYRLKDSCPTYWPICPLAVCQDFMFQASVILACRCRTHMQELGAFRTLSLPTKQHWELLGATCFFCLSPFSTLLWFFLWLIIMTLCSWGSLDDNFRWANMIIFTFLLQDTVHGFGTGWNDWASQGYSPKCMYCNQPDWGIYFELNFKHDSGKDKDKLRFPLAWPGKDFESRISYSVWFSSM